MSLGEGMEGHILSRRYTHSGECRKSDALFAVGQYPKRMLRLFPVV